MNSEYYFPVSLFHVFRAWYWGYLSFYDSSGYIQQLGVGLEENKAIIGKLQEDHWIDNL